MREVSGAILPLLPVILLVGVLLAGGMGTAITQSLGWFPPAGENAFTLSHYRALFTDGELRSSLAVTFIWASLSAALSLVFGMGLALLLRRATSGRLVGFLLQAPIAIPHLAMAIFALQLLGQSGIVARIAYGAGLINGPAGFPEIFYDRFGVGIVFTYLLKEIPFVALVALAMLRRAGSEYESVAATLGATAWQRFRYVTLPLAAPPVISATLIVFAFVFGAFEVPFLLGRTYPTMLGVLAQKRFLSSDLMDRPGAIAAGVVMSVAAASAVLIYLRQSSRFLGERPTLF